MLAARWLGLTAGDGAAVLSEHRVAHILGYEHSRDEPAIRLWNDDRHVRLDESPIALKPELSELPNDQDRRSPEALRVWSAAFR